MMWEFYTVCPIELHFLACNDSFGYDVSRKGPQGSESRDPGFWARDYGNFIIAARFHGR
jgi:hypothetical protein